MRAGEGDELRPAVRPERDDDADAIGRTIAAAFDTHPYSHSAESAIVAALRAAGALTVSLVAEMDGDVIGHVAASPVAISDSAVRWFGLGPISVDPAHQRKGVGSAMTRRALGELETSAGARGCVVLGDQNFYRRFGFAPNTSLTFAGAPPEYFMALSFGASATPVGAVRYHAAFYVEA